MDAKKAKFSRLKPRLVSGLAVYGLCAGIAAAATPLTGLPHGMAPLPARVLAQLRGRYVNDNEITYFGLAMQSTWSDAAGTVHVGTSIGFGLQGSRQVSITSYATEGHGTTTPASGDRTISGVPLGAVAGVGQGIQVIGTGNAVHNAAAIDVVTGTPPSPPPGPGGTPTVAGSAGGVTITPDAVTVAIDLPGRGLAEQTLSAQGLMQSAQVLSDANTVTNQMTLTVGLQQVSHLSVGALTQILASLHGVE